MGATATAASSLAKPLVLVVEGEAALATMLRYNLIDTIMWSDTVSSMTA